MIAGVFNNHTTSLQELNNRCQNTMASFLHIRFVEIHSDYLAAEMPVSPKTVQPLRMLNGGASLALAENVGSMAANLVLDRTREVALGLELNGNHLRPVPEGDQVLAKAFALHIGKSTHVWEIQITNSHNQLVFIGRLTMAVKPLQSYS